MSRGLFPKVLTGHSMLQELMLTLERNGHPGYKLPVVGTLRSTVQDLWAYEAVVDKWPDYKAVVLRPQKEHTRRFNYDPGTIYCYSDHPAQFASLVNQAHVIPWDKRLCFIAIPHELVEYVEEAAEKHGGKMENRHGDNLITTLVRFKRMSEQLDNNDNMFSLAPLPSEYTVGKLQPEHAQFILNHWVYAKVYCGDEPADWQNYITYLESCIRHRDSACVYYTSPSQPPVSSPPQPVSWQIEHLYGSGGIGHTLPEHRDNDMFGHTLTEMSRQRDDRDGFGYVCVNNKPGLKIIENYYWGKIGLVAHRFYVPPPNGA